MGVNLDAIKNLGLGLLNGASDKKTSGSASLLDQSQFLELMTTQLKNQNPLDPMKNGEFLSQMAQFSTVSGIQDLQKSFAEFSSAMSADQALQAANLVGRKVQVPSDKGVLQAGKSLEGQLELPKAASSVSVQVLDANGDLVKSLDLGAQPEGRAAFAWDGLLDNGNPATPGVYKLQAVANVDGQSVELKPQVTAEVESVTLGGLGGGLQVNLNGLGPVGFNDVKAIA